MSLKIRSLREIILRNSNHKIKQGEKNKRKDLILVLNRKFLIVKDKVHRSIKSFW